MKCYSLLLLFLFTVASKAAVYKVVNLGDEKVTTGDRVEARIVPRTQGASVPDLKGKRIAGLFYVMSQEGDVVEAIVAPPQSVDDAVGAKGEKFVPEGFKYEHKNVEPMKDFIVQDFAYQLGKARTWWVAVGLLLFLSLLFPGVKLYRRKKEQKRQAKLVREQLQLLLAKVSAASTRHQIEELYKHRNDLEECFEFDSEFFTGFFETLVEIQYKPVWSEEELRRIRSALEKFKKSLRIKSGI